MCILSVCDAVEVLCKYQCFVYVYLQLNCAASVASDFYFRSQLSQLTSDMECTGCSPISQLTTAPSNVGNRQQTVSSEIDQSLAVDLTLIVLWQVIA